MKEKINFPSNFLARNKFSNNKWQNKETEVYLLKHESTDKADFIPHEWL